MCPQTNSLHYISLILQPDSASCTITISSKCLFQQNTEEQRRLGILMGKLLKPAYLCALSSYNMCLIFILFIILLSHLFSDQALLWAADNNRKQLPITCKHINTKNQTIRKATIKENKLRGNGESTATPNKTNLKHFLEVRSQGVWCIPAGNECP